MIDFHCHVLPKMDDGSESCAESVAMLQESYRQGVRTLAATPHFYASENPPDIFLRRRAAAWERLSRELPPGMPEIRLGAEVQYFEGISQVSELDDLRLEGTTVLLLEMPFCAWTDRMLRDVQTLSRRQDYTLVLAHFERYLKWQSHGIWEQLRDEGVLLQSNAEFFLNLFSRRRAFSYMDSGCIHLLGSDSHNIRNRPTRMGEAASMISSKRGEGILERMDSLGNALLEGKKYFLSDIPLR